MELFVRSDPLLMSAREERNQHSELTRGTDTGTHLDYTFGITAKIEITKNEERHQDVLGILVKALERVEQCTTTALAVHRRILLAGL